jgi:hypothetical protein
MLFMLWLVGLLLFSAIGSIRLRHAGPDRYAPFIYTCALWWASLPALTGDWVWPLFTVPAGLLTARYMVRRRAREFAARSESARAI